MRAACGSLAGPLDCLHLPRAGGTRAIPRYSAAARARQQRRDPDHQCRDQRRGAAALSVRYRSGVFNAYYSTAAFGGLPKNMASSGLPTGVKYDYGDGSASNEFDSNLITVPSLTFYATPTSASGVTLNAATPSGSSSGFLVNAVYARDGNLITANSPALQATPTFSGYYGFSALTVSRSSLQAARRRPRRPSSTTAASSSVAFSARPWSRGRLPAMSSPRTGRRCPACRPRKGRCRVRP
jgi:hypothetical protein